MDTGPSGGFWSNLLKQTPGMLGSLGAQYGGEFAPLAAGATRAWQKTMDERNKPRVPMQKREGLPKGQMPGQQIGIPQIPNIIQPPNIPQIGMNFGMPGMMGQPFDPRMYYR